MWKWTRSESRLKILLSVLITVTIFDNSVNEVSDPNNLYLETVRAGFWESFDYFSIWGKIVAQFPIQHSARKSLTITSKKCDFLYPVYPQIIWRT